MTHNLEWRDVRAMFESLGIVEEEHNGNVKVTLAGHDLLFKSPSNSDIATADEVSRIRHFLQESKKGSPVETGHQLLVVIDHKETRIFRTEMKGSVPERVTPYDPHGQKTHVHPGHEFRDHSGSPNEDAYFADVAKSLVDAEKLLIFGSGSGSSSMMDLFVAWLGKHQPTLHERILAAVTIDESHQTEDQLLAKAREIYSK